MIDENSLNQNLLKQNRIYKICTDIYLRSLNKSMQQKRLKALPTVNNKSFHTTVLAAVNS